MKIAINAAFNPGGGAIQHLINTVRYLPSEDHRLELVIYVTESTLALLEKEKLPLDQYKVIVCFIPGISVITRILWEQLVFPFLLIPEKIDVLFCPGNTAPLFSSSRKVVWIHTIGPFDKDFCQHFGVAGRIKLFCNKKLMIASASRADAIIFESYFTKDLFVTRYGVRTDRTHVIHIGKDAFYYADLPRLKYRDQQIINKCKEPFILCVSHLYPYKNIIRLLEAYSVALGLYGSRINLIIAGRRDYVSYNRTIVNTINRLSLEEHVYFLGEIGKGDLRYVYEKCLFMAFPSPYENFSYTLVEAMSCGSAIACSNTTAMPETCKDAALYFDPKDPIEMAERLRTLITDDAVRSSLSKKSRKRAEELPDFKEVTLKTLGIMKALGGNKLD